MPLEALYNAPKNLAPFPGWSAPEPETGYMWFDAPIEIGGFVEQGLILRGGSYKHLKERHVTFELIVSKPGEKRRLPLSRVEWRSMRAGHLNRRRKGIPSSGKRVSNTHVHPFELNWSAAHRRMKGKNLPQAVDLEEDLQSFEKLREYVGKLFRISNIEIVTPPPWEYGLFDDGYSTNP